MGFWGALGSVGKGLINSATSNSSEDSLGGMLRKAINKKMEITPKVRIRTIPPTNIRKAAWSRRQAPPKSTKAREF